MRFLVDAQLPPALARYLVELGLTAQHVHELGLSDASDATIWDLARQENLIIVTKDEDFSLRHLRDPTGHVVWIRLGNCTNRALIAWLSPLWPQVVVRLAAGDRLVEVV